VLQHAVAVVPPVLCPVSPLCIVLWRSASSLVVARGGVWCGVVCGGVVAVHGGAWCAGSVVCGSVQFSAAQCVVSHCGAVHGGGVVWCVCGRAWRGAVHGFWLLDVLCCVVVWGMAWHGGVWHGVGRGAGCGVAWGRVWGVHGAVRGFWLLDVSCCVVAQCVVGRGMVHAWQGMAWGGMRFSATQRVVSHHGTGCGMAWHGACVAGHGVGRCAVFGHSMCCVALWYRAWCGVVACVAGHGVGRCTVFGRSTCRVVSWYGAWRGVAWQGMAWCRVCGGVWRGMQRHGVCMGVVCSFRPLNVLCHVVARCMAGHGVVHAWQGMAWGGARFSIVMA